MRPRRPHFDARERLRATIALMACYETAYGFHDGRLQALDAGQPVEVHGWELDLTPPNDRLLIDPDGTVTLLRAGDPFESQN